MSQFGQKSITNKFKKKKLQLLPWTIWHWMNGFPDIPSGQRQIGIWFTVSHNAFWPQVPGHGSVHLLRIQALLCGHSVFNIHSGRHSVYGSPWYSGKHVHTPLLQLAFIPQGFGLHGSLSTGSAKIQK